MSNIWIDSNKRRIERIKRQLIEYTYSGSYGGNIPLLEINSIIEGMVIEINKMDREITALKQENEKLKKND